MSSTKTATATAVSPGELARRVAERIRRHPQTWDQTEWLSWPDANGGEHCVFDIERHLQDLVVPAPSCRTTACVAGHIVAEALRAGQKVNPCAHIRDAAARLLGIDLVDDYDLPLLFKPQTTKSQVLRHLDDLAVANPGSA